MYNQLILNKDAKTFNGRKQSFQQMMLAQMDIHMQRIKVWPYLTPYTKINLKLIKNLNIINKTIKLLDKNIGVIFMILD